jgi:hypothetical protein
MQTQAKIVIFLIKKELETCFRKKILYSNYNAFMTIKNSNRNRYSAKKTYLDNVG